MILRPALLLALLSVPGLAAEPSAAAKYLQARDGSRAILRDPAVSDSARAAARSSLGELLRVAVGPVRAPGFDGSGEPEIADAAAPGEARLDALRFSSGDRVLLATTRPLLESFLASRRELPKYAPKAAQANAFYALTLGRDTASFANFVRILPGRTAGIDFALGSVGAFAREFKDQMPDRVVVVAQVGERVWISTEPANPVPARIPSCDEAWGSVPAGDPARAKLSLRRYQDCVRDHVGKGENLAAWKGQVARILEGIAAAK